ncbi:hypothetical protein VTO73DRAFT_9458 [Trametes versicolor]
MTSLPHALHDARSRNSSLIFGLSQCEPTMYPSWIVNHIHWRASFDTSFIMRSTRSAVLGLAFIFAALRARITLYASFCPQRERLPLHSQDGHCDL